MCAPSKRRMPILNLVQVLGRWNHPSPPTFHYKAFKTKGLQFFLINSHEFQGWTTKYVMDREKRQLVGQPAIIQLCFVKIISFHKHKLNDTKESCR